MQADPAHRCRAPSPRRPCAARRARRPRFFCVNRAQPRGAVPRGCRGAISKQPLQLTITSLKSRVRATPPRETAKHLRGADCFSLVIARVCRRVFFCTGYVHSACDLSPFRTPRDQCVSLSRYTSLRFSLDPLDPWRAQPSAERAVRPREGAHCDADHHNVYGPSARPAAARIK